MEYVFFGFRVRISGLGDEGADGAMPTAAEFLG